MNLNKRAQAIFILITIIIVILAAVAITFFILSKKQVPIEIIKENPQVANFLQQNSQAVARISDIDQSTISKINNLIGEDCNALPSNGELVRFYFADTNSKKTLNVFVEKQSKKILCIIEKKMEQKTQITCSTGVYNNQTKLCEIIPDSNYICQQGIYNNQTKICEIFPNESQICQNGIYDSFLGSCIVSPSERKVCSEGTYDSDTDTCIILIEQPAEPVVVFNPINELKSLSYGDVDFNAQVDLPQKNLDILVLYHGTLDHVKTDDPITYAQTFATEIRKLVDDDYGIVSVAYPQYGENFLFGDGFYVVENSLLWVKNGLENEFNVSVGKIYTIGHSQGGYMVTRLNTVQQVDGVIANGPGPVDLSDRCKSISDGTCLDLYNSYGYPSVNPQPYIDRSMISFVYGQKSPILFMQGEIEQEYQIKQLKIFEEKIKTCTNCASYSFEYFPNGNHGALIGDPAAREMALEFLKGNYVFD